jgi:hypothetical protein
MHSCVEEPLINCGHASLELHHKTALMVSYLQSVISRLGRRSAMSKFYRSLAAAIIGIVSWAGTVHASFVRLDTPCTVVHAAVSVGDGLALREAMSAGRQWLMTNDFRHVLRTEEQIHFWTLQGVGSCMAGGAGTLRSAMTNWYNKWSGLTADYQTRERDFIINRERKAQDYHERVMKNLGQ